MKSAWFILGVTVVGCVPVAPAPPAPRTAMAVSQSVAKTWEAAIDVFAERNIPIKTLDRSSGLVVAEPMKVGTADASLADCGKDAMGIVQYPTDATWNLLVRGDSAQSTIKATVRFIRVGMSRAALSTQTVSEECSTRGTWETQFEQQVKAAAEAKK